MATRNNIIGKIDFVRDLKHLKDDSTLDNEETEILRDKLRDKKWVNGIGRRHCPDALSAKPLGEWRNDGFDVVQLKLNRDKSRIATLQMIKGIKKSPKLF